MRSLAALLLLPAFALIGLAFLLPLLVNLATAITDPELRDTLPHTAALLRAWQGQGLPDEAVFAATAQELAAADAAQNIGALARRLNFEQSGLRSLLLKTAHADLAAPYAAAMATLDPRWADPDTWRILRRAGQRFTALYLLRALDLTETPEGDIVRVAPDQAVFLTLFARTLVIALSVTVLCVLIGYPVAYTLTTLPPAWARVATGLVLVPFWISMIVRTTAWFILLQREGPLNAALLALGISSAPVQMIFTRFTVIVAMVHVLLPFMVLPLAAVMRRIDPAYLRAAASLGASGPTRFLRVYLPLTMQGLAAGTLLVFMLSVGYFVTPALIGGPGDQMVSLFIADYANTTLNWGMAAALSCLLLAMTGVVAGAARLLLRGMVRPA